MPSPFPGMNPYLEQEAAWHDFHKSFIPMAAETLGAQVRPRYFARIEEGLATWTTAVDWQRLSHVAIRDRHNRQLITVLELLSPANKRPGRDRDQYVDKRNQLLASAAHFVEIDLLRGGPRMPLTDLPPCDYYALVSRVEERPEAGLWPIRLRDQLPVIPVPLRTGEADARLDLQEILHRIYDAAGYAVYIYDGEPDPRLAPEDAAWAEQFLPRQT